MILDVLKTDFNVSSVLKKPNPLWHEDSYYCDGSRQDLSKISEIDIPYLNIELSINGNTYDNEYVDLYSLMFSSLNSRPYYDELKNIKQSKNSSFYVFSCSCGVPGCSGFNDGIHVKVRGRTIEWRIKDERTFKILGKRFFAFDKHEYIKATHGLKDTIFSLERKYGKKMILNIPMHNDLEDIDYFIQCYNRIR